MSFQLRPISTCSVPRHAPSHHGRFHRAAGFVVMPSAVGVVAWERQLICSAMILAKNLNRHALRRDTRAVKFRQSSFACCHLIYSPKCTARPRRIEKSRPMLLVQPPAKSQRQNEVAM